MNTAGSNPDALLTLPGDDKLSQKSYPYLKLQKMATLENNELYDYPYLKLYSSFEIHLAHFLQKFITR